ncbi:eukaryotic translation initiation factor NCBP [Drosophila eugracilis]|uniref:eukaryotic translation initiation factor NCBP n=1 Tax=Drosophila eugracilis TaxID=29029 RepID=UPI0007E69FB4|nr:eukaryotic translation initiation factor NCBP [Drosophila eugracilis]XP_017086734.1 eukaryotic translation initiation factor NCBP [Drosophila eugracilis]
MFPNNFYKMKNFANPKTMFKSNANNDDMPPQATQTVAAPTEVTNAAAVTQPAAQPMKPQNSKNAPKKTPPVEPPKQGKNKNKKAKKTQKDKPRSSSQASSKNVSQKGSKEEVAETEKSKGSEVLQKGKGQENEKVQEKVKEKVQEKEKNTDQKTVQEVLKKVSDITIQEEMLPEKMTEINPEEVPDKMTLEQKLLEKIEKKLKEQQALDEMLEPNLYQTTYDAVEPIYVEDEVKPEESNSVETAPASEVSEEDEGPQHPLNSRWTLWYLENDRTKSWEEMLHEVTTFDTVENFWSLMTHIKPPSELKIGSDYCLFKKGIRPMWEDQANVRGGRWVISLTKNTKTELDTFWMDSMLCLIGEDGDFAEELCGAVVNIRGKSNKISIWTADGAKEGAVLEIGRKLREGLHMDSTYVLQYQLHKDTMVKQGSTAKSIYIL